MRYLFISNSNKPTLEKSKSREAFTPGNVSKPCLETAHEMGYEVWMGLNREHPEEIKVNMDFPVHLYDSHTYRDILNLRDNYVAYKNAMKVLRQGDFKVIHCNTPIGGVIGRLCGKRARVEKVIYTVHGFHFYEGAPLLNRTILKWAEMFMAHWTDAILTMNQEDYEAAQKFKLRNHGKVYYVPGVGIDTEMYKNVEVNRNALRKSLGLKEDDVVCIAMGNLVRGKNYGVAIEAIAKCAENVHYLICGNGPELERLKAFAVAKGVENRVHFLGFRTDVKELLKVADIFLFTSLREGLSRAVMEAMASGLPCIVSRIRGNVDLLEEGQGGFLLNVENVDGIAEKINLLSTDSELRERMKRANFERIKLFDVKVVRQEIKKIYSQVFVQ